MNTPATLYDSHRGAPAVLNAPGLTAQDILDFCEAYGLEFSAIGTPKNWNNTHVFWALSKKYRGKSKTIPFSRVTEWKQAIEAMGPKAVDNTPYIHHRTGEKFIARHSAYDLSSKRKVVVFENQAGVPYTLPHAEFFSVAVDQEKGSLVPRFAPSLTELVELTPYNELYDLSNLD